MVRSHGEVDNKRLLSGLKMALVIRPWTCNIPASPQTLKGFNQIIGFINGLRFPMALSRNLFIVPLVDLLPMERPHTNFPLLLGRLISRIWCQIDWVVDKIISLEEKGVASKATKWRILKHIIRIYWPLLFRSDLFLPLYLHDVTYNRSNARKINQNSGLTKWRWQIPEANSVSNQNSSCKN